VYSDINGGLEKIADKLTAIPEGTGNFTAFSQPWIRDGAIVFRGAGSDGQDGIYKYENGLLSVVADTTTPMPSGPGSFASFGDILESPGLITLLGVPAFDMGITVFQGTDGNGHAGVYMEQGGVVSVVADTSTAIPGGVGVFTGFDSSVQGANTRAGMVSFVGDGSNGQQGIYIFIAGVLAPAIDTTTFVPDAGMVSSIGTQSYGFDGGFVSSLGQADAQGIFTTLGGSPRVVIKDGDLIYGRPVSGLGTYGQSLQGSTVGFNVGSYGADSDQNAIFLARLVLGVEIAVTPARINVNNGGRVPVAVLANADFNAPVETAIPSLRFGRTGTEASLQSCRPNATDVNGDSLPDLVCHFSVEAAGFQVGDTEAFLTGETVDGVSLEGSYPIRIAGT
jgi:hypothetical protein